MKKIILIILLFILSLGINDLYSQSIKDTLVVDFKTIDKTVHDKINLYGAESVLVVVDIDNTLLTSDTDLGSDIWYQWQRGELKIKPAPEQKLMGTCLFDEAIGLLYELGRMSLTDSLLPGYIRDWQNKGVTVFALTSRSPGCRAATERELKRNNVDLRKAELCTNEGKRMILSDSAERKFSYIDGIMMTSGMNKGGMLTRILDTAGRSFKAIIFVDDTPKNIEAVRNNYLNSHNAEMVLFHYTKILSERLKKNNNVDLTPAQAEKMDQDWDELIRTLYNIYPERMAKSVCTKQACFSIDDLPVVVYGIEDAAYQESLMSKLIRSLNAHHVPAIGFVNEKKLYNNGNLIPYQADLIRNWVQSGLDLGNHTFSHPDYNNVSLAEFTADLIRGETVSKEILAEQGKTLKYFRHPYLHAGNTKAKADSLDEFLVTRGYTVAPVTIDNEDYLFAKAYHIANQKHDTALMEQIGSDYISYMEMKLIFYEGLSDSLFKRNIPQILLIHASLLNADYIGALIALYEDYNYSFASMDQALQDPAYRTPVMVYGNWGISWIDRWALSQGKKGDFFKDDPVTPEYIRKYGSQIDPKEENP